MKIIYARDYDGMSRKAANIISAQIILKPDSVLGLATGSSPMGIYRQLVQWYEKGDLDFSRCKTVNLDEYVGLGAESTQSYLSFMNHNLFDHVNICRENIYIPDGKAADGEAECLRYNHVIRELGGIDIQLLGVGHNGHIGFNEPGGAFEKEAHCVKLAPRTMEANARFFKEGETMPTHAYTMGIKSIMNAKKILLVVYGKGKAEILSRLMLGRIEPSVPASILQLHNDVTVIADDDALSLIPQEAFIKK